MEKVPMNSSQFGANFEKRRQEVFEDLRALCEVLDLPIIREEVFNSTPSVVVDNGRGEEVHIGFPDGTNTGPGKHPYPAAATDTIWTLPRGRMGMYGHGVWRRSIEI